MKEKTRKHSSRMRTSHFSDSIRSPYKDPLDRDPHPGQRPPSRIEAPPGQRPSSWTETTLLDRDAPPGQRPPSWTETPQDRDPHGQILPWTETSRRNMRPWPETPSPRSNMGTGRGSDIIQRQTPLEIIPCPKFRLRTVINKTLHAVIQ